MNTVYDKRNKVVAEFNSDFNTVYVVKFQDNRYTDGYAYYNITINRVLKDIFPNIPTSQQRLELFYQKTRFGSPAWDYFPLYEDDEVVALNIPLNENTNCVMIFVNKSVLRLSTIQDKILLALITQFQRTYFQLQSTSFSTYNEILNFNRVIFNHCKTNLTAPPITEEGYNTIVETYCTLYHKWQAELSIEDLSSED